MRSVPLARMLLVAAALAAGSASAADAEKGAKLVYSCFGCHGIESYKNAYPKYSVPRLGGQNLAYLQAALDQYASGARWHPTMQGYAMTLTPAERADVAAFFSSAAKYGTAGGAGRNRPPPDKAELCVACHGRDGEGTLDEYPSIGGQHADYLRQALEDYRDGKRNNAIMMPFAQQLTDEDIRALSDYFASKPGLVTPGRD